MTRFADPLVCPDCRSALPAGALRCGSCGLVLAGPLGQELFATLRHADEVLARMRREPGAMATGMPPARRPDRPARLPVPRVRAVSVPRILLGLGALCLVVAALVFLAVTWALLGVGGRTAVLLGATAVAAVATDRLARRGLRAATEALGAVTLALVALDGMGAWYAGWVGPVSGATLIALLGLLLLVVALAATVALRRSAAGGFAVGEAVAAVGSGLLSLGLAAGEYAAEPVTVLVALGAAVAAAAAVRLLARWTGELRGAAGGTAVVVVAAWCALVLTAGDTLGSALTVAEAWGSLRCWPLLAAAAVAAALGAVRTLPTGARVTWLAGAGLAVALAAVAPAADEGATTVALACGAVLSVAAAGLVAAPARWAPAALGPAALGALGSAGPLLLLAALATTGYAEAAAAGWDGSPSGRFPGTGRAGDPNPWLLPLGLLVQSLAGWAALRLTAAGRRVPAATAMGTVGAATAVAALGALVLLRVPVWTVLLVLVGVTAGAVAVALRPAPTRSRRPGAAALGAGAGGAAALVLGLHDETLTALAAGTVAAAAAVLHVRGRSQAAAVTAGAAVPPLLALLGWTLGALLDAPAPGVALAGIVVLGAVAVCRVALPSTVATGATLVAVEGSAALSGVLLGVAGAAAAEGTGWTAPTWVAAYLTAGGVAAGVMAALREDRRRVGWLAAALLVSASWVRLAELSVEHPEPYTLPGALGLLVAGVVRLRRRPGTPTVTALGSGLVLAVGPSLVWALRDPVSVRAALLGVALLGLVVAGLRLRWSAPLLVGAAGGAVLVVREVAPLVGEAVPRWGLIGAAGAVLVALGVTWEQRMTEARAAARYVRALR